MSGHAASLHRAAPAVAAPAVVADAPAAAAPLPSASPIDAFAAPAQDTRKRSAAPAARSCSASWRSSAP